MKRFLRILGLTLAAAIVAPANAIAVDPPYQAEMERLTEIMGSLYFLQPICGIDAEDWRQHASDLISLDNPDDDRRQRLIGAFNQGFSAYSRTYRQCTESAEEAMMRLLVEAERASRDIHTRFAE